MGILHLSRMPMKNFKNKMKVEYKLPLKDAKALILSYLILSFFLF